MKNLIYFNPDEMRGDAVSVGGHPLVKTPNLDRLAARGTAFTDCHVQHTVCTPSRCSFMTGLYPHVNGHRTLWHSLRPHEPNTFSHLHNRGYRIEIFGKNDVLSEKAARLWVDRVHTIEPEEDLTRRPVTPFGEAGYYSFLYEPGEVQPADYHHVANAVEALSRWEEGDAPFFFFLALGYPHCPYRVPEPWYSMYDPEDLPPLEKVREKGAPLYHKLIRQYRRLDELGEGHFKKIMAVYLGMISYMDSLLGRLLDVMDRNNRWDDTVFMFFSDHGDWAGDYGLVEKWPSALEDKLTRVPLIITAPGMKKGQVSPEPVELLDIHRTTLDLLDIPLEHTAFGISLLSRLKGGAGECDRPIFAEGGYDEFEPHCFEGKTYGDLLGREEDHIYYPKCRQQQEEPRSISRSVMIRKGTWKFVRRRSGDNELYDLSKDRGEEKNLYGVDGTEERIRDLERELLDFYLRTSDVTPFTEDPRSWPAIP